MRLAYVVDVHDRFEAVSLALAEIGPIDVLVVGGDLTNLGTPAAVTRAIESWQLEAPQLLAVAGNMDSPAIDARLVELGVSLDGRGVVIGELGLAGVSAAPHSPLHTPYELPDSELGRRAEIGLAAVRASRVRIFCPHAPPQGTACDLLRSGEHVGSPTLRAIVEREQPDLVLCGHIHESRGEDMIGVTRVVNPGPVASGHYAVVDVADEISVALD
jgi:Icc-related predicted phosphoesterase